MRSFQRTFENEILRFHFYVNLLRSWTIILWSAYASIESSADLCNRTTFWQICVCVLRKSIYRKTYLNSFHAIFHRWMPALWWARMRSIHSTGQSCYTHLNGQVNVCLQIWCVSMWLLRKDSRHDMSKGNSGESHRRRV